MKSQSKALDVTRNLPSHIYQSHRLVDCAFCHRLHSFEMNIWESLGIHKTALLGGYVVNVGKVISRILDSQIS